MEKFNDCNKVCLKADFGKMLYNESNGIYTPKAYLFSEDEESEWTEVDELTVNPEDEEISNEEALSIIMGVSR